MNTNIVTWQPGMSLEQLEKQTILAALRFYRSNQSATAQSLGITVKTLYNKLQQYEKGDQVKAYTAPTHKEILERGQKDVIKTGPRGEDHRIKQPLKPVLNGSGEVVERTGPRGTMSEEQLEQLRNRKLAKQRARMESQTKILSGTSQDGVSAQGGVHVQPAETIAVEHPVPVSEREEIQEVPLPDTTGHRGQQNGQGVRNRNEKTQSTIQNKSDKKRGG